MPRTTWNTASDRQPPSEHLPFLRRSSGKVLRRRSDLLAALYLLRGSLLERLEDLLGEKLAASDPGHRLIEFAVAALAIHRAEPFAWSRGFLSLRLGEQCRPAEKFDLR